MSDNTRSPESSDLVHEKLKSLCAKLESLLGFSYGPLTPGHIIGNLRNIYGVEGPFQDPHAHSPSDLTHQAIESVKKYRNEFRALTGMPSMNPLIAIEDQIREHSWEFAGIREYVFDCDVACADTVQALERVSAVFEGREYLSVPGLPDSKILHRDASEQILKADKRFKGAVEALQGVVSMLKEIITTVAVQPTLIKTTKPAPEGDGNAKEPGDAPEGDEDADAPEGDEDADEPDYDEDAEEPEDAPEGDEDAEEGPRFSEDSGKKKRQPKYPCQGQRHDGHREPGGRGPEQSPARRPDKPGQGKRKKKGSKKNTYYLDPVTDRVCRCYPDTKIPANALVIRQPPGTRAPSRSAFYDFSLLPKGSSLSAPRDRAYVEDNNLKERLGKAAGDLGLGEDARWTLFQQLGCTANPNAAFNEYINAVDRDLAVSGVASERHDAALKAAVAAGNTYASVLDDLPGSISARTSIIEASKVLEDLLSRGAKLSGLTDDPRDVSVMAIDCGSYPKMQEVCDKLRKNARLLVPLGAKIRGVSKEDKDGRKYWQVTVEFSKVPAIELAAALSGKTAEISYQVVDGKVSYQYKVSLRGIVIETALIPCLPTVASAGCLLRHLMDEGEPGLSDMVDSFALVCDFPHADLVAVAVQKFAAIKKTICTVEDARQALSLVSVSDVVSDEMRRSIATAPRTVSTSTGKTLKVAYRHNAAQIDGFSFHPADPLVVGLVDEVPVGDEQFPTRIRHVRFEKKKNGQGLKAVVTYKDVSEIRAGRENYFASRAQDPVAALREELRQHFISEVTRDMASMLLNPEKFQIRNAEDPEEGMKRAVRRRHVDPYRSRNGDIVRLVATLTLSSPPSPEAPEWNEKWHKWCQDSVGEFRRNAKNNRRPAEDFFAFAPGAADDSENLIAAGMFLVGQRLGRDVSREELYEIAKSCGLEGDGTGNHKGKLGDDMFRGVDQGRALARALADESGKTLPKPARKQKRPEPGNQAEVRGKSEVPRWENSVVKGRLVIPGETRRKQEVAEPGREPGSKAEHEEGLNDAKNREDAARHTPTQAHVDEEVATPSGTETVRTTPVEALVKLANDENAEVRYNVAENPSTTKEVLALLASDDDRWVRFAVTENPSTPVEVLALLASDEDKGVRFAVARNPSTPPKALAKLASDEEDDVRQGVAMNRSTPPEVLAKFASDENIYVRRAAAANPSTPKEVLAKPANASTSSPLPPPTSADKMVEGSGNHAYAEKALLLKLGPETINALQAIPVPGVSGVPGAPQGTVMTRIPADQMHVTLISYGNFVNEPDREKIANPNFPAPRIEPGECRFVYRPEKVTYVLSLRNQEELRGFVNRLYEQAGKKNPEPNRFFHVTLANNMGGDPFKSIGDVKGEDFR